MSLKNPKVKKESVVTVKVKLKEFRQSLDKGLNAPDDLKEWVAQELMREYY